MNMASKLGKIVEAFDQKVGPDYLVLRQAGSSERKERKMTATTIEKLA
jgi:hypothetical protein